jgi:hypothetical protein
MQYIFNNPDWQLVSDHAKFCLDSEGLIFGILAELGLAPSAECWFYDTNRRCKRPLQRPPTRVSAAHGEFYGTSQLFRAGAADWRPAGRRVTFSL